MSAKGPLRGVIEALYESALGELAWTTALRRMVDALGGVGASLEIHDLVSRELLFFESAGLPTDGVEAYQRHYAALNPRIPTIAAAGVGETLADCDCLDERSIARSEFYQDFLAPADLRYFVAGVVLRSERRLGLVAVQRAPSQGHVTTTNREQVLALIPHVRHALALHQRLSESAWLAAGLAAALEQLEAGVVLTNAAGRVFWMNPEAERLLSLGKDSWVRRGELRLTGRPRRELAELLARAEERGSPPPAPRIVGDVREGRAVRLTATPLTGAPLLPSLRGAPTVLLLVQGLAARRLPRPELLRRVYGLTPTEARLGLALLDGDSLRDYAEQHEVSINTVRTQLAHLRAKVGVRTQAALVRALGQLA